MGKPILRLAMVLLLSACALAAPHFKTLFSYKEELGLTPAQISAIKAQLSLLKKSHDEGDARLKRQEDEYLQLLSSDAGVDEARVKLRQIADTTVEMRLKDFQISRAITAVLTPEQRRKWQEIRQRAKSR